MSCSGQLKRSVNHEKAKVNKELCSWSSIIMDGRPAQTPFATWQHRAAGVYILHFIGILAPIKNCHFKGILYPEAHFITNSACSNTFRKNSVKVQSFQTWQLFFLLSLRTAFLSLRIFSFYWKMLSSMRTTFLSTRTAFPSLRSAFLSMRTFLSLSS